MSNPPDDQQRLRILDDYLARLQAGEPADRDAVLRTCPELASALDCLEALEHFASGAAGDVASKDPRDGLSLETMLAGRQFGPYELLEEIGRGGMGVVFKARQSGLDRLVAVKMILASHLGSAEHLKRFEAEAKAAARLRHPHIVPIHEVGQMHGQPFFVMEYVEGVSLAERLAQGPMTPDDIARLLAAVAGAVAQLHQQGIVHRDLKPANILLDTEGRPYLTDFGLAKLLEQSSARTATGVIAGTPSYMSPEQAAGLSAEVGPASDIYSLGAILYELLAGRPPFSEPNPIETMMQVVSRDPVLPRRLNPRVPRALESICLKCLAKSPARRYASADALAADLEHFLRDEPLDAQPPGLGQRLTAWARREPALASRLAALAVFYLVELVNYDLGAVDRVFHRKVSALVVVWAVASILLQRLLASRRWSIPAAFAWSTLDSALLWAVLWVGDGVNSPLVVGYFLLIVASALWFRVRFVWFMAALSLLSYTVLTVDLYTRRAALTPPPPVDLDNHVIFAVALLVEAAAVAYLVRRLHTLSSFHDRRR